MVIGRHSFFTGKHFLGISNENKFVCIWKVKCPARFEFHEKPGSKPVGQINENVWSVPFFWVGGLENFKRQEWIWADVLQSKITMTGLHWRVFYLEIE